MAVSNISNRTLFIADNLEIMRGINDECIDLIYLDPPFNSNRNYKAPIGSPAEGAEFKDIWTDEDIKHEWHGEIADRNQELYQIIQASEIVYDKSMKIYLTAMAVRLLEMKRILKPTGSIYLHCDPTASHYLKMVMDGLFGSENFRNEIIWHYDGPQRPSKKTFGAKHDVLIRYSKTDKFFADADGIAPLTKLPNQELRNYKKDEHGKYFYDLPKGDYTDESIERLDEEGRIYWTKNGKPRVKYFLLADSSGVYRPKQLHDVWSDIISVGHAGGKEKTGYPTQKPLALLKRIIKASSNEGDVVLDPFCGCATACVAAEQLGRQWIGIDISPSAEDITKLRLQDIADEGANLFNPFADVSVLSAPPVPIAKREQTISPRLPPAYKHKRELYGRQEGICAICNFPWAYNTMTVDHITPKTAGCTDRVGNLRLICHHCKLA